MNIPHIPISKTHKKRLGLVLAVLGSAIAAVALIVYALSENLNLFFSPSQVAAQEAGVGQMIRVGGMVVEDSIVRDNNSLKVQFDITDMQHTMTIHYNGILPDLFKAGQGVVVRGVLQDKHHFVAEEVLAKHDENYMPPEVKAALDNVKAEGG